MVASRRNLNQLNLAIVLVVLSGAKYSYGQDPRELYNQGNDAIENKEYDLAIGLYTRAIQGGYDNPAAAYTNRGVSWRKKRDFEKALRDFNSALRLSPRIGPPRINRAEVYLELRRFDEAIADVNYLLKLAPKDVKIWELGGDIRKAQNEYKRAAANYSQAIRLGAKTKQILRSRQFCYSNLKEHTKALADNEQIVSEFSPDPVDYVNRGGCLMSLRRFKEAIGVYDECMQKHPDDDFAAWALLFKAQCWHRQGQFDKAVSFYDQLPIKYPNHPLARSYAMYSEKAKRQVPLDD